jgi:hypothetical protein
MSCGSSLSPEKRPVERTQQNSYHSPSSGVKPKNWLVESILVTLFCCLPFGIAGIINASKVDSKYASGDYQGAQLASQEAGKWTRIGFYIGLVLGGLYILSILIGTFSSY